MLRRVPPAVGKLALLALLALPSCGPSGDPSGDAAAPGAAASSAAASVTAATASLSTAACAERADQLRKQPALPGAPSFEANRVELSGRPRGTPVLWKRVPETAPSPSASAASAIEKLAHTDRPLALVKGLVRRHGKSPETLRAIFLREGYVYADRADLALALVETLRLTHLFREPVVYLLRGHTVHALRRAERTRYLPERYLHDDGPLRGAVAELLLGDRFALDRAELEKAPAALDLIGAAHDDGFDRIRVKHLAEAGVVAEVRYGEGTWLTAVLEANGAALRLACVDGAADAVAARARVLEASGGARKALAKIRATVHAEVQEEPRFDEPKDEPEGEQQDGMLRREWRRAYSQGLRSYTVGQNKYDVYDEEGRAVPPQVCIDFITDTWERASGTWYKPLPAAGEGERPRPAPERLLGGVDFDKLDLTNRRSVAELVNFAKRHPDMFDVLDVPQEGRIPFARRGDFFSYVSSHGDDFAEGDVLVIFGAKSDGRPHYHSLIVVEQDPITGVPTLVAGNAGRPREQTLEGVMARSPKRSIKHRVRPKAAWLASAILGKEASN